MPASITTPLRQRTVGIDLAISAVQVAQVFDDGSPVGKPIRFRLTPADLKRFITALKAGVSAEVPITALMEPTGMAWFPVAAWLQRAGVKVIRVKGQRVKALRKYLSEHTKSDSADAHVLGAMPGFGGRGLDAVHGPEQHALQRLTKQRQRYQELVCSARRRVLDLIRWACPALEAALPDTMTKLTLAILGEFFDPRQVVATRRDVLGRFLGRHASGNHPKSGPFIDELVDKLKAAAEKRSLCTLTPSTSAPCSSRWLKRSSTCGCGSGTSTSSSDGSSRSTSACIPRTRCVRSPASGRHWPLC